MSIEEKLELNKKRRQEEWERKHTPDWKYDDPEGILRGKELIPVGSNEPANLSFIQDLYEWAEPNITIAAVSKHPCFLHGKHFFKIANSDDEGWLRFICVRCGKLHTLQRRIFWWWGTSAEYSKKLVNARREAGLQY